ncbi:hypothetical protein J2T17_000378 [Paenibacillus mucilaginosus]|uniref:hypothetical protein n=1 Tax=Paenibacillus mucilaginosus TaxID=61624 RepID=UPI003D1F51CC
MSVRQAQPCVIGAEPHHCVRERPVVQLRPYCRPKARRHRTQHPQDDRRSGTLPE